jgi:hypothetical protein
VNGELNPDLVVTNVDTAYHHSANLFGGSATVTFRLENRGNIRMAGSPKVTVGGPFGLLGKSVTLPDISELLPGEDLNLAVELTGVPALMFNSTEVTLTPSGADDATTSTATDTTFAPPLALLLVLLAGVLFLLAMRARRRRVGSANSNELKSDPEPELLHQ